MLEITGLWQGQTKSGNVYLSGYWNKARILIFKNKHKQAGTQTPQAPQQAQNVWDVQTQTNDIPF